MLVAHGITRTGKRRLLGVYLGLARYGRSWTLRQASMRLTFALHGYPCGYYTDPYHECHCTLTQIRNHLKRVAATRLFRVRRLRPFCLCLTSRRPT